jgi:copper transport protein
VAAVALGCVALVVLPVQALGDAARAVMFAGTLCAVGAAVFMLFVHDGAGSEGERLWLRRVVLGGALAGIAGGFAGLVFQAAEASGRGLAGAADPLSWHIVMTDGGYAAAIIRGLGLSVLAYAASSGRPSRVLLATGAALGCAWCLFTGHTVTKGPHLLVHVTMLVHVVCAATWVGGLVALGVVLRRRRAEDDLRGGAAVVKRFSLLMTGVVGALVACGVVITIAFLGSPGDLVSTSYGLVLTAKIATALTIIGIAGYNQRRLVPAVMDGSRDGWASLRRTVFLEQAGLAWIVVITAVLVNLDPGS